jgi:hypothetical protein
MNRREAYRVLCVAPSADGELVERAYRHLSRKYRAEEGQNGEAEVRLAELKEAYSVLAANGKRPATKSSARKEPPPEPPEAPEPPLLEVFLLWARELAASTAARWEGHVTEITVLTACLALLTALAFLAGADLLLTILVAAVAAITIWSPWRRLR